MNFRTEREYQNVVCQLARRLGCIVYHTHDARRSEPGFPDLVIVGDQGVLFRELKTDTGRMSAPQLAWLARLTNAGADAAVWRPIDWPQRVTTELRAVA